MRLIDADKLLGKLDKRRGYIRKERDEELVDRYAFDLLGAKIAESEHVTEVVEKMAATPVDPVKHGHWIFATADMSENQIVDAIQDFIDHGGDPKMWRIDTHYCSGCLTGYHIHDDGFIVDGKGHYCPNCGAKLDSNNTD